MSWWVPLFHVLYCFLLNGRNSTDSETLNSYELGYRQKVNESLTFDLALFYNSYSDLIAFSGSPNAVSGNFGSGNSYGLEFSTKFDLSSKWRVSANYTFVKDDVDFGDRPGILYNPSRPFILYDEKGTATHNIFIHSNYRITENIDFDITARYLDQFDVPTLVPYTIQSYIDLGARIAWRPTDNIELSLIGKNLLTPHNQQGSRVTEVPRSFLFLLTYSF